MKSYSCKKHNNFPVCNFIIQKINTFIMKLIVRLVVNAFALLVVGYLVPGFHLDSFWVAVIAAIVIGIANILIRPILQFIAFPISRRKAELK